MAIFHDWKLIDWRVKLLDGKWSKKKIDKVLDLISEYAALYDLNTLAIKTLHPSHSSKNLGLLVSRIKTLAGRKKLEVNQFSIREIEHCFLAGAKNNKRNLAEKMVSDYPCLVHEFEKEKAHKNPYQLRMFEAVATGAACFKKSFGA